MPMLLAFSSVPRLARDLERRLTSQSELLRLVAGSNPASIVHGLLGSHKHTWTHAIECKQISYKVCRTWSRHRWWAKHKPIAWKIYWDYWELLQEYAWLTQKISARPDAILIEVIPGDWPHCPLTIKIASALCRLLVRWKRFGFTIHILLGETDTWPHYKQKVPAYVLLHKPLGESATNKQARLPWTNTDSQTYINVGACNFFGLCGGTCNWGELATLAIEILNVALIQAGMWHVGFMCSHHSIPKGSSFNYSHSNMDLIHMILLNSVRMKCTVQKDWQSSVLIHVEAQREEFSQTSS